MHSLPTFQLQDLNCATVIRFPEHFLLTTYRGHSFKFKFQPCSSMSVSSPGPGMWAAIADYCLPFAEGKAVADLGAGDGTLGQLLHAQKMSNVAPQ